MALSTIRYPGFDYTNPLSFRNRLINGDCRVSQRGSVTAVANAVTMSAADRWYVWCAGANVSTATDWVAPSLPKALRISGATSNTAVNIGQRIESSNIYDLAGLPVTVSGWIFSNNNQTPTFYVNTPNVVDDWTAATWMPGVPFNLFTGGTTFTNNTWSRFRTTFTLPASATNGLAIEFNFGSSVVSGQNVALSGVQLEAGNYSSPYEYRDAGDVLRQCQRYFLRYPQGTFIGTIHAQATNYGYGMAPLAAPLRRNPTLVGVTNTKGYGPGGGGNVSSGATQYYSVGSPFGLGVNYTTNTWTAGYSYMWYAESGAFDLNAELV